MSGAHVVTGSDDNTARIWAWQGRVCLHVLEHPNSVWAVAFSSRGDEVITGCADGVVRCFAVGSGQLTRELRGHSGEVKSVASAGDVAVSGDHKGTIKVWSLAGDKAGECVATIEHGDGNEVCGVLVLGEYLVSVSKPPFGGDGGGKVAVRQVSP